MGGGSYNYISASSRSANDYSMKTREEIFRQSHLNPEMNIRKKKIRESRDSEEHPESFPIIIALDETGSMGMVPEILIKDAFPDIIKLIMDAGISNPQVCFCGVGDSKNLVEEAPIQCGEFESSDELMEKWLKSIYLEGYGQGNGGEAYYLAWYFAAHHTAIDSFEKRGKRGVLITIGDEPIHRLMERSEIKHYFGDSAEKDIPISELLKTVSEKWDVYHIHIEHGTYRLRQTNWEKILDTNVIPAEGNWSEEVKRIIPNIVIQSYKGFNDLVEVE